MNLNCFRWIKRDNRKDTVQAVNPLTTGACSAAYDDSNTSNVTSASGTGAELVLPVGPDTIQAESEQDICQWFCQPLWGLDTARVQRSCRVSAAVFLSALMTYIPDINNKYPLAPWAAVTVGAYGPRLSGFFFLHT